jgi:hypothetical protein
MLGVLTVKRFFSSAFLVIALLLSGAAAAGLQTAPAQYFPETGHTVREPFITYFNQTGGLSQHGYPITDDYVDSVTGFLMQYFEKSRIEWHPGNAAPYRIQLGLLGDDLGKRQAPIPISAIPAANDPNCTYSPETSHSLCHKFREYWLQNGGLDRFGFPITEITIENGLIVQYFQRARMEWHPEKPAGQNIMLAPLGLIYYKAAGLDPARLLPPPGGDSLGAVTSLRPRASVVSPVSVANGAQTAYVFVTDQLGRPIGGAGVTLVVHYPGRDEPYTLPPTSAKGTSFTTFLVPKIAAGTIVSMEFIVTYSGVFGQTRTSYMVWY